MARVTQADRDDATAKLKEVLRPGDTVWLRLDHVSASGMSRIITPMLFRADVDKVAEKAIAGHARGLWEGGGGPSTVVLGERELYRWYPGRLIRQLFGLGGNDDQGVRVAGCGMDMGMHLVTNVAAALFGDERALEYKWL